jgi:uncharacterized coiled-coil DUF342 family protein
MGDQVETQPAANPARDYEEIVTQLLAEMQRLNEQMRSARAEIERLRAETDTLKLETVRLRSDSQSYLSRLVAAD